ncbi:MAG: hypothetical protein NXH79_05125 [Rhodobacteraceae bacterium]|nr:hypothetical protein [Paracoccaceae bacterium]
MPEINKTELLYDHVPKPDAKVPPIRETRATAQESRRIVDEKRDNATSDLLSSLNFG